MERRIKNDELQKGFAEIKRKAILLAALWVFTVTIVLPLALSFMWIEGVPREVILFMATVFAILLIFCFFQFKKIYEKEGISKLVKRSLDEEAFTEVKMMDILDFREDIMMLAESYKRLLPIENPKEYRRTRRTISDLIETAKFYARISTMKDNSIQIFVKYEGEEKKRYYKTISTIDFFYNYLIREESET